MEQLENNVTLTQLTKKEFFKHQNLSNISDNIKGAAFVLYFCGAITLIAVIMSKDILAILDVLLIVGFGLGIHFLQSRACAILMLVYALFNVLIVYLSTGSFGGYLPLIGAIYATIYTFKFHKAWKKYKKDGTIPEEKEKGFFKKKKKK